ncbi:phosphoribosylformylglycinamidine cyclo-ligase [Candidatus Woesearchaeota archaeon]|nr:phosphoribosylformylglycinamidine cyclo-ligase [Candidatus Woesearchaeota archaeon]
MGITYASAGVNVQTGEKVAGALDQVVRKTWTHDVVPGVSGFKAMVDRGSYYLIAGMDGVGTKVLIAVMANSLTTVGQDLVAMCANDVLRVGAKPIMFLDYIATGILSPEQHLQIVDGVAEGCRVAGVPLIGGETAEMPGMYKEGHFDLVGTCVGMVEKHGLIDGSQIRPGAVLVGIASSGLHSNGYSLVRHVIFNKLMHGIDDYIGEVGCTLGEELLRPTLIYCQPVFDLLAEYPCSIQGLAHITGGGMPNKLPKALPEGLGAEIVWGSWPVHPIFGYIAKHGPVELDEMRRTFNMGIGMVAVVNDANIVPDLIARLREGHNLLAYNIGRIVEGEGVEYV